MPTPAKFLEWVVKLTVAIISIALGIVYALLVPFVVWIVKSIFSHDKKISSQKNVVDTSCIHIKDHESRLDQIERQQIGIEATHKRIESLEKKQTRIERKLSRALASLDRNVSLILEKMNIAPAKSILDDEDEE